MNVFIDLKIVDERLLVVDTLKPLTCAILSVLNEVVKPKDKSEKTKECGLVYSLSCENCPASYVGETARSLGTRFKEHTDGKHPSSAVWEHIDSTGHQYTLEKARILTREDNPYARKIREALLIAKHRPDLNRDRGLEIPPTLLRLVSHDRSGHVTTVPTKPL